jgi:hypothetical protein
MESLESRCMMTTTTLAIDFTPDGSTGDFWDTFRFSRYSDGSAPAFLDFNGDRRISGADAEIAAGQIRNAVGSFFAAPARGYSVSATYNDVLVDSNWGTRYLQYGQQRANEQVLVMFVGGRNRGELGLAPIALDGYNVEGFGRTYSQEIALNLMQRRGVTKEHFVWSVAQTIAHEYGHMLGLRHSLNVFGNDIMNPSQSATPWNTVFSTVNQNTEGGPAQNSVAELRRSFAGQYTYFQSSNRGHYQLPAEHGHESHHDDEHEHEAEGCTELLNAIIDGIMEGHAAADQAEERLHPLADEAADLAIALSLRDFVATCELDRLPAEATEQPQDETAHTFPLLREGQSPIDNPSEADETLVSRRQSQRFGASEPEGAAIDALFASSEFDLSLLTSRG